MNQPLLFQSEHAFKDKFLNHILFLSLHFVNYDLIEKSKINFWLMNTDLVLEAALRSLSSSEDSSASDPEHQLSSELLWETECWSVLECTSGGTTRRSHTASSQTPERTRGSSEIRLRVRSLILLLHQQNYSWKFCKTLLQ